MDREAEEQAGDNHQSPRVKVCPSGGTFLPLVWWLSHCQENWYPCPLDALNTALAALPLRLIFNEDPVPSLPLSLLLPVSPS